MSIALAHGAPAVVDYIATTAVGCKSEVQRFADSWPEFALSHQPFMIGDTFQNVAMLGAMRG